DERCGSASTRIVRWPDKAACAARWVAMVVLPTPPLELATRIVFTRTSVAGHLAEAYHRFGVKAPPGAWHHGWRAGRVSGSGRNRWRRPGNRPVHAAECPVPPCCPP